MSENIKQMSFEQYLDEYGELVYSNVGVSMMPMIRQGKDTFTLKKKTERCRKHDVVLFKRGKSYVLHRVVKVLKDGYMVREVLMNCFKGREFSRIKCHRRYDGLHSQRQKLRFEFAYI